jgi:hypothetical protein
MAGAFVTALIQAYRLDRSQSTSRSEGLLAALRPP